MRWFVTGHEEQLVSGNTAGVERGSVRRARIGLWSWPAILFIVGLGLSYGAALLEHRADHERERAAVQTAIEPVRGALARELSGALELTEGLSALISLEGGISEEKFSAFAARLLRRNQLIHNVALAPDNMVTMVYPLEGSERAIGLDYAKNDDQWPSVERMMKEKHMIVAGPVRLVQGGVGVIGRSPIYVRAPTPTDPDHLRYWGLNSTVVDFEGLLAAASLDSVARRFSIALRGVDGVGHLGDTFWGDAGVFDDSPVVVEVPLASGSWQLAAVPRGGWSSPRLLGSTYFVAGCLVFLVLAAFLSKVLHAGVARDVEVAQRLESERKLRALFEQAPLGIALVDSASGTAVEVNPRYAAILGYPEPELLELTFEALTAPDHIDEARETMRRLRDGAQVQAEHCCVRKDGSMVWLSLTCVPLARTLGPSEQHLAMVADVTEAKQSEAQLLASERLAALGMLAAGVAHEINNPLAAVMTNLELALREVSVHPSELVAGLQDSLLDAHECAGRVRSIVRDLKVFSRAEDEQRGPVDVSIVLGSTLRIVSNDLRHRARLVRQDQQDLPLVEANESRLGQVFLNLLVNAIQALPTGHADENEVRVQTRTDAGGDVVVEISDTGNGMSPNVLKQLFTPFFTTRAAGGGTGLGLATCQRIVADLGGRIEVKSEVGVGSTFMVYLRRSGDAVVPQTGAVEEATPRRRGRVMIVDDEALLGSALSRLLSVDHDVASTTRAQDVIERVAAGERYDVILCDLMMPEVTGMELHAALQRSAPDQADKIIFMTGGAFSTGAREFLERVSNPRLEKPFDGQALRALVNTRIV